MTGPAIVLLGLFAWGMTVACAFLLGAWLMSREEDAQPRKPAIELGVLATREKDTQATLRPKSTTSDPKEAT